MWLSFLIPLGVYFFTTAPGIFWEDSAAFQAAAYELGIVHSPSFPAYLLLAHLFTLIPLGTPQWLANLSSAVFAALSTMMVFLIASTMLRRDREGHQFTDGLVSLACALAFSFVYGVWVQAVRAEVYALNLFLALLIIWLVLRYSVGELTENRLMTFAGITLGVGFANHYLILGVVAVPVFAVLFTTYRAKLLQWRLILRFGLFVLLGLSLYIYLPLRENYSPMFNWGDYSTLGSTLRSILRLDESLPINQLTVATPFFERFLSTIAEIWRSLPLVVWAFSIAGIVSLLSKGMLRFGLVILTALASVLVTAYAADFSRYNLDLYGYLMPAYAGLFIAAAIGAAAVKNFALSQIHADQKALRGIVTTAIVLALFAKAGYLGATNFADADKHDQCTADVYSQSILESLEPQALFLAGEDNSFSPLLCKQLVDGYRRDVMVLSAGALLRSDYRRKTQELYGCLWYPSNWNQRSFAEQFQQNLAEWISRNSANYPVALTLSQWTSPLIAKLQPQGFCYTYSDTVSLTQDCAAKSVLFYRDHENLWRGSPDITTREHFGRLLYNLSVYYSKHQQPALAAKYNRDAASSDSTNVDLLLGCLKMAILTKQPDDQQRFASAIENLDPGNQQLEEILKAALALAQGSNNGN